uniref:hypothetical protein n=1 Tax=Escherichia coli TaxID=562 RepID=UPI001BCA040D
SIICSPMTSLKTSIKIITYLSDIGCLEIQGASLSDAIRITSHITIKKIIFTSDARSKTVTLNTLKR